VAGLFSALRITGRRMRDQRVVFAGAGASAQGISDLLVAAFVEDGLTRDEAVKRIWTTDSHGLVTTARPKLEAFKAHYARATEEVAHYTCRERGQITLVETIANAKPTMLIGTSATPAIFDEAVVREMAKVNERPIIFPLSNPTSKSECTPEDAIRWSEGRAIVATGSPFKPVTYGGKHYRIGQGNNAFVFPGIGLGLTIGAVRRVTDGMFLEAAKALAAKVTPQDLENGAVYPELARIRECSFAVACAAVRRAIREGLADTDVMDVDHVEQTVERAMWFPEYLPLRYEP
jgi:malate dehydrogenase (oxaloacetate-decarboxylating)